MPLVRRLFRLLRRFLDIFQGCISFAYIAAFFSGDVFVFGCSSHFVARSSTSPSPSPDSPRLSFASATGMVKSSSSLLAFHKHSLLLRAIAFVAFVSSTLNFRTLCSLINSKLSISKVLDKLLPCEKENLELIREQRVRKFRVEETKATKAIARRSREGKTLVGKKRIEVKAGFFVHNLRHEFDTLDDGLEDVEGKLKVEVDKDGKVKIVVDKDELKLFEHELINGGVDMSYLKGFWPNVFLRVSDRNFSYWFIQFYKHGDRISSYRLLYFQGCKQLNDSVMPKLDAIPRDSVMTLSEFKKCLDFDCTVKHYHHQGSLLLRVREIHVPFSASGWDVNGSYWKGVLGNLGLAESYVVLDLDNPPNFSTKDRLLWNSWLKTCCEKTIAGLKTIAVKRLL
ncbi:unconventional myosin-XVIIIa isoform a, partial [Striga asiatica]